MIMKWVPELYLTAQARFQETFPIDEHVYMWSCKEMHLDRRLHSISSCVTQTQSFSLKLSPQF